MTLSLSLGASIGFRKTLAMMSGELVGVGLIVFCVVLGMASILVNNPSLFTAFKWFGGAYLFYLGVQLFLSRGKLKLSLDDEPTAVSSWYLASQGFITAIFNPKGWAFFVALLPGFIDYEQSIGLQLFLFLVLILPIEFISLCIYALGGRTIKKVLSQSGNVTMVNRFSGILMMLVGVWLALS